MHDLTLLLFAAEREGFYYQYRLLLFWIAGVVTAVVFGALGFRKGINVWMKHKKPDLEKPEQGEQSVKPEERKGE